MRSLFRAMQLATLGLVLLLASEIPAQQPAPSAAANPFAKEIAEMKATRTLLEGANHDYKGHRAAAVKEITAAIHALEPPHQSTAAKVGKEVTKATGNAKLGKEAAREVKQTQAAKHAAQKAAKKATPAVHEAQVLSDVQLKEAVGGLRTIQLQMAGSKSAGAAKASAALQVAVKELEIALTIK